MIAFKSLKKTQNTANKANNYIWMEIGSGWNKFLSICTESKNRDEKGIIKNSPHAEGHATIYPTRDMSMTEFETLFSNLPWKYAGSNPKKR